MPPPPAARRAGALRALLLAVIAGLCLGAQAQRLLVQHETDAGQGVAAAAMAAGLQVLAQLPSLTVLRGQAAGQDARALTASAMQLASGWPGVLQVEEDLPRYMHRPWLREQAPPAAAAAAVPAAAAAAGGNQQHQQKQQQGAAAAPAAAQVPAAAGPPGGLEAYVDCSYRDVPLPGANSSALPEYMPYGVRQVQAADSAKLPRSTEGKGVLICLIDSGVDAGHPDLQPNEYDGCKYEDAFAPGGCPYNWNGDMVGHGTHVAGTISARRNGLGVVGVIPDGAELYVVRVFNDSGDVNQGQGLVYGSSLILAYTQCEGRLAAMQAAFPLRQYRMVVSMSLGAPGPLSIEQLFFREAVSRGDIVFVASSGNNGTDPTFVNGKLTADLNPSNYPGAYPEVVAVAAVDCANRLAPFSQKNDYVDIAAPGVEVLSTASRQYAPKAGLMQGSFAAAPVPTGVAAPRVVVQAGVSGSESQVRYAGAGRATGRVADCGAGDAPCPAAKDNICMVQYDPRLRRVELAAKATPTSSPPPGAVLAAGGKNGTSGAAADPLAPLIPSGPAVVPMSQPVPTRFSCDAMEFCMRQGAKAMLIAAPAVSSGFYGEGFGLSAAEFQDLPFVANLRCTAFNCSCWARIGKQPLLPAAGLSLRQFGELRGAVAAAAKAGQGYVGTVESRADLYQRLSGTSMAVPHVSAAIARVWADFPNCNATTVRASVEQSALDLGPKGKDTQFGHGLLQAEAAYDWLSKQPCAAKPSAAALAAKAKAAASQAAAAAAAQAAPAAPAAPKPAQQQPAQQQQQQQVAAAAPKPPSAGSSGSAPVAGVKPTNEVLAGNDVAEQQQAVPEWEQEQEQQEQQELPPPQQGASMLLDGGRSTLADEQPSFEEAHEALHATFAQQRPDAQLDAAAAAEQQQQQLQAAQQQQERQLQLAQQQQLQQQQQQQQQPRVIDASLLQAQPQPLPMQQQVQQPQQPQQPSRVIDVSQQQRLQELYAAAGVPWDGGALAAYALGPRAAAPPTAVVMGGHSGSLQAAAPVVAQQRGGGAYAYASPYATSWLPSRTSA